MLDQPILCWEKGFLVISLALKGDGLSQTTHKDFWGGE